MAVESIRQVEVDKAEAVKMIAEVGGRLASITNFINDQEPNITELDEKIYDLANEAEAMIDALEVFILGHDPMEDI